nr:zinc finger protein 320-like [Vanessa tameamea]
MAFLKSTYSNSEENKFKFEHTSSFNKYFICHYCERKFLTKQIIEEHVLTCLSARTCEWCSIVFKNRGNLVTHAYYIHNDKSLKTKQLPSNTCSACEKSFANKGGLKYHIRRSHFNLVTKIPSYSKKQINQVWFEKVLNTDSIVEIKKSGNNVLLIRKYTDNKQVRVQECKVLLDLSTLYPTGNRVTTTECEICKMVILDRDFKKHYDEKHSEVKKHHCNNCNMTFKRSYFFVRHTCNKKKRKRNKLQCKISKIESLTPIQV